MTGEFPAQRASNAENVSIWWRNHDTTFPIYLSYKDITFPSTVWKSVLKGTFINT